jgi:hypothetical protein
MLVTGLTATFLWVGMLSGPWDLASGLLDARTHLDKAEKSLGNGNIKSARYETLAAVAAARRARAGFQSAGPVMDLLRRLPKVGSALDETEHFVRAAELSAEAAKGTLDIAEGALRGPDKIIERDPEDPSKNARFRIERITEIGATIAEVRRNIQGVKEELSKVDPSKLPRRFRDDIADGIERARETDELLADAAAGFAILPGFLGADGPRTYLIAMQNPAEQRGTGGSILQITRMTIDDGSPNLPKEKNVTESVYNVDRNRQRYPDVVLPEDAWYVREVPDAQRFGNANWSPDWPLSSDLMLAYARRADPTFPEVDGVISVDPIMLSKLMPGVGRFVTNRGNVISQRKAVPFLLNKAYATFPITSVRRHVLSTVVDRFYAGMIKPRHPTELVQGFGESLSQKHMQIWLRNPTEQAFIERMDWDGGLDEAKGADYFNVVEQNVGGNKLDYFQRQTETLEIDLSGNDAQHSAAVSITNGVYLPQPRYVLGDSGGPPATGGKHGTTRPMMNVYVPATALLTSARIDGTRVSMGESSAATWPAPDQPPEHIERGKKVWSVALEIPVGDTQTLTYGYRVQNVVRTVGARRVYRLVIQHQPKVNPERLVIRIRVPEGAEGVTAKGFLRRGDVLVLDRIVNKDFEVEVSWKG